MAVIVSATGFAATNAEAAGAFNCKFKGLPIGVPMEETTREDTMEGSWRRRGGGEDARLREKKLGR